MPHYKSLQDFTDEKVSRDNIQYKSQIINILGITEEDYGQYQLIVEDDNQVKIAQIPYHYLKS